MSEEKVLYLWLEGNLKSMPEVHLKAAAPMDLTEFRDKYVDTSKTHLVIRLHQASDDAGQTYHIELSSGEEVDTEDELRFDATSLSSLRGLATETAFLLRERTAADSVEALLSAGATAEGRANLAFLAGLPEADILHWVQLADLIRVPGIGRDYSALLWAAGITSVPQLAGQEPATLEQTLATVNETAQLTSHLPSLAQVQTWVAKAATLPPAVLETGV